MNHLHPSDNGGEADGKPGYERQCNLNTEQIRSEPKLYEGHRVEHSPKIRQGIYGAANCTLWYKGWYRRGSVEISEALVLLRLRDWISSPYHGIRGC